MYDLATPLHMRDVGCAAPTGQPEVVAANQRLHEHENPRSGSDQRKVQFRAAKRHLGGEQEGTTSLGQHDAKHNSQRHLVSKDIFVRSDMLHSVSTSEVSSRNVTKILSKNRTRR
jgi:hypothetical protein